MSMQGFPTVAETEPVITLGIQSSSGHSGTVEFDRMPDQACIQDDSTNAVIGRGTVGAVNGSLPPDPHQTTDQIGFGGMRSNGYSNGTCGGEPRQTCGGTFSGIRSNYGKLNGTCGGGTRQARGGTRTFTIIVRAVGNNKMLHITISPDDSVDSLKSKIRERVGIPEEQQKLVSPCGKNMQDRTKLSSYDLHENSQITLTTRLRGG